MHNLNMDWMTEASPSVSESGTTGTMVVTLVEFSVIPGGHINLQFLFGFGWVGGPHTELFNLG